MARGRKPKPTFLRLIDGNAGHRPINADEPIAHGDLDAPPAWLTPSQQKCWRDAIRSAPEGLLKEIDASVFLAWVVACDAHRISCEKIAQYGALIKSPTTGNPITSPYVKMRDKQAELMMRAASEMGFTPSSRSRVRVSKHNTGTMFDDLKELDD